MSAGIYKIWCEQGATFILPLQWKDSTGAPVDLNGYSARMDVRKNKNSPTAIARLSTEDGEITLGDAGLITLTISAEQTEAFDAGQYIYDLEMISGGGEVYRLIEGAFVVDGNVTR